MNIPTRAEIRRMDSDQAVTTIINCLTELEQAVTETVNQKVGPSPVKSALIAVEVELSNRTSQLRVMQLREKQVKSR
jgi:hypothetical protein